MTDLPDMSLTLDVTVTGTVDASGNVSVSAIYSQAGSNPVSSNVVDSSGDIDLNNMAYDSSSYNVDTDITVNLSGQITDTNGNSVNFSFPQQAAQAVTITRDGGGNSDINALPGNSLMQVIIDDNDDDGAAYSYCLSLWVETAPPDGQLVALDPRIVNR
ncbi:hypothetical protein [Altererythrobacter sp. Root672]|uniref:hypothetical protein n=1 Tax=Altererythrobacter sp. Root672 TaxID=1736584 RepID=UPI000ACA7A12|nr:hypothetical protein [Altererythrobacter sp. Root672]